MVDDEVVLPARERPRTSGDLGQGGGHCPLLGDGEPDLLDDLAHGHVRADMVLTAQGHAEGLDDADEVGGL